MPAKQSAPKQDHTEQPLFNVLSSATLAPDGAAATEYKNDGDGLSNVSGQNYAESNGMLPNAPTSGAPRKTSKSATYPWTADVAVNASKVTSSDDVKPID